MIDGGFYMEKEDSRVETIYISKLGRKIHPKPVSQKEWDFFIEVFTDFIMTFEHNADTYDPDDETTSDKFDIHIHGMAKGMWTMLSIIEERMVSKEGE
jgi:hypothetical protein